MISTPPSPPQPLKSPWFLPHPQPSCRPHSRKTVSRACLPFTNVGVRHLCCKATPCAAIPPAARASRPHVATIHTKAPRIRSTRPIGPLSTPSPRGDLAFLRFLKNPTERERVPVCNELLWIFPPGGFSVELDAQTNSILVRCCAELVGGTANAPRYPCLFVRWGEEVS